MECIGPGAVEFFQKYNAQDMQSQYHKILAGIIALRKKYGEKTVDMACSRACYYGNISYRTVKNICEKGVETLPFYEMTAMDTETGESKVRSLEVYRRLARLGVITND
jgi:hypothetical protein